MKPIYPLTENHPVTLADNILVLGNYHFCQYLVKGTSASALIEVGVTATAPHIISTLKILEIAPHYLIVSHPHADHVMGLPLLKEAFPECIVICGYGANEFLSKEPVQKTLIRDDLFISVFLKRPLSRVIAPTINALFPVKDGDSLDLGGITLSFLEIKGHSPGHIGVFIREIEALFPSDALGFFMPSLGFFPTFFTGYDTYLTSLKRLESLHASLLGLPHQGFVRGEEVKEAFFLARKSAHELYCRICSHEGDEDELIEDIYQIYYRDELKLYPPENIKDCCRLLVRRAKEHMKGGQ
ncbi:MAG: MBL fold metallo-hydrolase [Syntrophales bacterium]|nr:MBL fold metallo-hydrolase [Syntrophales bacterium]